MIADLFITESIQKGETGLLEKRLTENPALAESTTREGVSLLLFALYCSRANHGAAVELIKRYKPALDCYEATCLGEFATLAKILDQNPDLINTPSIDGFSLLGYACFFNQPAIAGYLVKKGADVNSASANSFKVTPLHSAAAVSSLPLVRLLVENGADVNARQQTGFTALHAAAGHGATDIITLLLEQGADVRATTDAGETALSIAEKKHQPEAAGLIRSHMK